MSPLLFLNLSHQGKSMQILFRHVYTDFRKLKFDNVPLSLLSHLKETQTYRDHHPPSNPQKGHNYSARPKTLLQSFLKMRRHQDRRSLLTSACRASIMGPCRTRCKRPPAIHR